MRYNDDRDEADQPLYSIEDEPLFQLDTHDDKRSEPDDSEEEDDEEELDFNLGVGDGQTKEATPEKEEKASPMGLMFKTMLTPVEGWKALKRASLTADRFASGCFYPLVALAAVSQAAMFIYEANVTVSDWVMKGLDTFVSFFFGYFTVLILGGIFLPKKVRPILKKDITKQFIMLAMSTLALFYTVMNLLPMLDPVLVFLPLWTLYLVFKGVRVLRVPKDAENTTTGVMCVLIVGAPILWNWLMTDVFSGLL